MKKKLENKLKEFAAIRKFANGLQRKELIDQEVRVYLAKVDSSAKDWYNDYEVYKEMYSK
jgi:hypothetical protein